MTEEKKPKTRKLVTQQIVLMYLKKLKPRYVVRVPLRCKHDPVVCLAGQESVAGACKRIRESVFHKLRKRGKLKLKRTVNNATYSFQEYKLNGKGWEEPMPVPSPIPEPIQPKPKFKLSKKTLRNARKAQKRKKG